MDTTPEAADREAPAATAPDHSIRGWQMLAEARGQEADTIRTERDTLAARLADIERADKVRQLESDYPEAVELYRQQGAEAITPTDEPLLAAMQTAFSSREPRIDPNQPRRTQPRPVPNTAAELAEAVRNFPTG